MGRIYSSVCRPAAQKESSGAQSKFFPSKPGLHISLTMIMAFISTENQGPQFLCSSIQRPTSGSTFQSVLGFSTNQAFHNEVKFIIIIILILKFRFISTVFNQKQGNPFQTGFMSSLHMSTVAHETLLHVYF